MPAMPHGYPPHGRKEPMTTIQLIEALQALVRVSPNAAHKPVEVTQYDEVFANEAGRLEVTGLDYRHDAVVIQ